ncbi:MAG: hypothetical protein MK165_15495, partial [Pirellulaceae bacterium]|nr:hypothetical protein [Pirellulaceae bacterium]
MIVLVLITAIRWYRGVGDTRSRMIGETGSLGLADLQGIDELHQHWARNAPSWRLGLFATRFRCK